MQGRERPSLQASFFYTSISQDVYFINEILALQQELVFWKEANPRITGDVCMVHREFAEVKSAVKLKKHNSIL